MMGLIVILFAVCILPIQIAWLISDFGSNEHKGVGNVLLRVADIAAYLHACVNPVVYGTITKYFGRQYMRYIKSIFHCLFKHIINIEFAQLLEGEDFENSCKVNYLSFSRTEARGKVGRGGQGGKKIGQGSSYPSSSLRTMTVHLYRRLVKRFRFPAKGCQVQHSKRK